MKKKIKDCFFYFPRHNKEEENKIGISFKNTIPNDKFKFLMIDMETKRYYYVNENNERIYLGSNLYNENKKQNEDYKIEERTKRIIDAVVHNKMSKKEKELLEEVMSCLN